MKVKIFMNTAVHNSEFDVLKRFGAGVEKWLNSQRKRTTRNFLTFDKVLKKGTGNTGVEYDYSDEYTPCDVAVIFGSWKDRKALHHNVRNSVATRAPVFVCIETPLLTRKVFQANDYYRVGVNGFLNHSAYWNADEKTNERFEEVLGLSWNGWADDLDDREEILLGLQLAGDASLRNNSIVEWCLDTVKRLRRYTNRPIRIRTHPGISERGWEDYSDIFRTIAFEGIENIRWSNGRERPWTEDIINARTVVTYSSGLSIDAILAGVPVIATDPGNFAWDISSRFADNINEPHIAHETEVREWLNNLAYCQWSPDEMLSGECWQHLLPAIQTATDKHNA